MISFNSTKNFIYILFFGVVAAALSDLYHFNGVSTVSLDNETVAMHHTNVLEKGEKADFNFNLVNSKGEKKSLEDFRGKVIFINLWATWCPPCVAEMPSINAMYNSIDPNKVEVVMISLDQSFPKAVAYRDKEKMDFEVYAPAGPIPTMYATRSIPTTYIIDSKGNLAMTHKGMADYNREDFKVYLQSL